MGLLVLVPQKLSSKRADWQTSSTRTYKAAFTDDCDENYVRDNLDPFIYQYAPHPTDLTQLITDWEVDQDLEAGLTPFQNPLNSFDGRVGTPCYWWDATVNYGPVNPLEVTLTGNPADQPIMPSFLWTIYDQPVDIAITGKNDDGSYIFSPVVNSANIPFDPAVTRDLLRGTIKVSQNYIGIYPVVQFFNYGNAINNDQQPLWNGFAQYTIKFTPPNMPEKLWSQYLQTTYYRLDYTFDFNPSTWQATPIDRGYEAMDQDTGEPYKILDINGQPVSQPALLDGEGNPLINPTPSTIRSFMFQIYPDLNFTQTFGPQFAHLFDGIIL